VGLGLSRVPYNIQTDVMTQNDIIVLADKIATGHCLTPDKNGRGAIYAVPAGDCNFTRLPLTGVT
jgi:hypothetical protein